MPAFGCNEITRRFAAKIFSEPVKGFRLSDRVVSAVDRFVGALSRFRVEGESLMGRWLYLYLFVGGSDWTHALNLADTDGNFSRFTITWSGTVTHNEFGVTFGSGGQGNTHCDCADAYKPPPAGCSDAWNRKSHGFYSRTNSAVSSRDMSAAFLEPRNGNTYFQGIIPRYGDGTCFGDLTAFQLGATFGAGSNRVAIAVGDSLGLFSDTQRGPTVAPYHFIFKRGVYLNGENTSEIGMGYGEGLGLAVMVLSGLRNLSFVFSTKHQKTLNYPGLPGDNADFNYFVEQLQVALLRNV